MDIIQLTEISALYLEREGKFSGAESPWQNISRKKKLAKLKKENKFNNKTYFRLYSFDAIPPRLYWAIKAHKPEKNYPMRTIVSTLQTASYGTSNYLAEFIEPILNKNKHPGKKPSSFENKAATWETTQEHIQVSNDVINSYSSIAIDKAITVFIETLNNDLDDLLKPTNQRKTILWGQ